MVVMTLCYDFLLFGKGKLLLRLNCIHPIRWEVHDNKIDVIRHFFPLRLSEWEEMQKLKELFEVIACPLDYVDSMHHLSIPYVIIKLRSI